MMGVDVSVFLGRVQFADDPEGPWFQIDAMVAMGGEGRPLAQALPIGLPTVYLYAPAGDGNKAVTVDRYDSRLTAWPLARLAELLRDDGPHVAMLRALITASPPWVTHAVVYCS